MGNVKEKVMEMFCSNCEKETEDSWRKCPYCGSDLKTEQIEPVSHPTGNVPNAEKRDKKKRKKWPWIMVAAIALVIIIFAFNCGGSNGDNKAALALVQNGTYGDYDSTTIKEMLEYNWKDGIWDSFIADDKYSSQIVEYAAERQ